LRHKESDIYNIGTGVETSINELAQHIKTLVGSPLDSRHKSPKMGDAERSCLDAKKAKQKLSWEPKTSLKAGIGKTIASFKAYN
jgi:UDP-glucose 4-epimerase